jgi:hypothetical protein
VTVIHKEVKDEVVAYFNFPRRLGLSSTLFPLLRLKPRSYWPETKQVVPTASRATLQSEGEEKMIYGETIRLVDMLRLLDLVGFERVLLTSL